MTATQPVDQTSAREQLGALLDDCLAKGTLSLPVLPDVALRVQQSLEDRNVNSAKLARVISAAPGLAARVLKVSNSAMYAARGEITDLGMAVSRIGLSMVLALVVGAVGKESFRAKDSESAEYLENSWMASVFASVAARGFADLGETPRDTAFLAGLLHATGRAVLIQVIERQIALGTVERPPFEDIVAAIEERHAIAGAKLLERWQLPQDVADAVAHQREPEATEEETRDLARILALAARFGAEEAAGESPVESAKRSAESDEAKALGLDFEAIERIYLAAAQDGMAIALAF